MPHPKPDEIIPINTVCLWQRNKSKPPIKVTIKRHVDLYGAFQHYEGEKVGESGNYAFFHDDLKPLTS